MDNQPEVAVRSWAEEQAEKDRKAQENFERQMELGERQVAAMEREAERHRMSHELPLFIDLPERQQQIQLREIAMKLAVELHKHDKLLTRSSGIIKADADWIARYILDGV